jgi:hypothetical protein
LHRDASWLKDIQDRVGGWHDELALGQWALKVLGKNARDRNV